MPPSPKGEGTVRPAQGGAAVGIAPYGEAIHASVSVISSASSRGCS